MIVSTILHETRGNKKNETKSSGDIDEVLSEMLSYSVA